MSDAAHNARRRTIEQTAPLALPTLEIVDLNDIEASTLVLVFGTYTQNPSVPPFDRFAYTPADFAAFPEIIEDEERLSQFYAENEAGDRIHPIQIRQQQSPNVTTEITFEYSEISVLGSPLNVWIPPDCWTTATGLSTPGTLFKVRNIVV